MDAFNAAYPGIEVEAYDMPDVEQIGKLRCEQAAGIYNVDVVFLAGTTPVAELSPNGLIWNYVPNATYDGKPTAQFIPPEFRELLLVHSLESKGSFTTSLLFPTAVRSTPCGISPNLNSMDDPMLTEENMVFLAMFVQHADAIAAAYAREFGRPF